MRTYNKNLEALSRLTPEQYRLTQTDGTKRAFANEYWDNKAPGLSVDVVSGEPLFASSDKFDSGAGWPSFTKPIEAANIVENMDRSHDMTRIEVRSKHGAATRATSSPTARKTRRPTILHELCLTSLHPPRPARKRGVGEYVKLFSKEA